MPAIDLTRAPVDSVPSSQTTLSAATAARLEDLLRQLRQDRDSLELRLFNDESFRALKQLQAREASGRPLEVLTAETLRQHLMEAMTTPGDVLALQRLEQAIAVLSGDEIAVPMPVAVSAVAPTTTTAPAVAVTVNGTARKAVAAVAEVFLSATRTAPQLQAAGSTTAPAAKDDALGKAEAAIFASVARLRGDGEAERLPSPQPAGVRPPPPVIAPALLAAAETATAIDRLERIRGIDSSIAAKLRVLGITRYAQIVQWTAADIAAIVARLGADAQISRHNWIEQAAMLASGRVTRYARAVDAGIENPGRRIPVEPVTASAGEPGFFRIGLPAVPVKWQQQPRPALSRPFQSRSQRDGAKSDAVLPSVRERDRPMAPPVPNGVAKSGYQAPADASVRLGRLPEPVAKPDPRLVSPIRPRPAAASAVEEPSSVDNDWAEVTIIPREPAAVVAPVATQRPVALAPPNRPSASPVLRSSLPSRPLNIMGATAESRPIDLGPTRRRDVIEEEAVVEIRRHGSPPETVAAPAANGDHGPLHRLLRALTPSDRGSS